jgi:hypothetical protein
MVRGLLPALLLFATHGAAAAPPPPELAAHVRDGALDRTTFAWLRGAAADASPSDKAAWARIEAWQADCFRRRTAAVRAELKAMGVDPVALPEAPYGERLCAEIGMRPLPQDLRSWAAFQAALAEARPVFEGFRYALRLAVKQAGAGEGDTVAARLKVAVTADQMVRNALGWERNMAEGAPPLSPAGIPVMDVLLGAEMFAADRAGTAILKEIVEKHGWPKKSEVGAAAAQNAWLLVQHADEDPVFQLRALRLMEPLMASGEVSKGNVAYLYDRIMLKIAGRQRYGTQFGCIDGRRAPRALEDPDAVDRHRIAAGIGPLAEYQAFMEERFGKTC